MQTTNVKATYLNYHHYENKKYDRNIIGSIPHYCELHQKIAEYLHEHYNRNETYQIIDLGAGTGTTSKLVLDVLPNTKADLVDFSQHMLNGARQKLGRNRGVRFIFGDYSKIKFDRQYNIAISVIGLHHQNNIGKKKMFNKIYDLLKPGGIFIFADLVTYRNKFTAALNNALHFKHLADHLKNKTLSEWAHHHMFLNDPAPIEDQVRWLKKAGFRVQILLLKINTALLICKK